MAICDVTPQACAEALQLWLAIRILAEASSEKNDLAFYAGLSPAWHSKTKGELKLKHGPGEPSRLGYHWLRFAFMESLELLVPFRSL